MILDETADPEETEPLVEIPDPKVVVILEETPPPTEAVPLTETPPAEGVTVIVTELDVEHIRRARALVRSETTTVASPDGCWAAVTISMSEGLRAFWPTVDAGHVPKAAELGKKMPDAADPAVVAAVPEK